MCPNHLSQTAFRSRQPSTHYQDEKLYSHFSLLSIQTYGLETQKVLNLQWGLLMAQPTNPVGRVYGR